MEDYLLYERYDFGVVDRETVQNTLKYTRKQKDTPLDKG